MQIPLEHNLELESFKNNRGFILLFFGILVIVSLFLTAFGFANHAVILMAVVPLSFLFSFNFELTLAGFVLSFFIDTHISYATPSELFCFLLILSFFVTHKFSLREVKTPLIVASLAFLVSVVPSFINAENILLTVAFSFRLVLFSLLIVFVSLGIKDYDTLKRVLILFLFMCVLNALHTIFLGITTGRRVFGFAGVMFVDYVSIGLVISFIFATFSLKIRVLYSLVSLILLAALIFTQTRNTWISCGVTLLFILIQFIFKSAELGYSKRKVILIVLVLFIGVVASVFIISNLNPEAIKRLSTAGVSISNNEETARVSNIGSLATRFFIWITAWNAFLAHPIVGIGLYNFPYVSQNYSTISPVLYEAFVKGLSPHITFLAILTETGIVGMIGFGTFLVISIKTSRKSLKDSKTREQFFFSNIIFWINIYILFSMLMSDAWLWGHGLMLWGLFLALSTSNKRLISLTN